MAGSTRLAPALQLQQGAWLMHIRHVAPADSTRPSRSSARLECCSARRPDARQALDARPDLGLAEGGVPKKHPPTRRGHAVIRREWRDDDIVVGRLVCGD